MILDCLAPNAPRGVFYDDGTGKRIPFVRWANTETGEYVALVPDAEGNASGVKRRGRAVGQLRFVPMGGAIVVKKPLSEDEKLLGMEQYRKLFFQIYKFREHANRHIVEDWRRKHG